MRNIKLTLEYDGTDFVGWQYQTNGRSVQGVVEKALGELLQEDVRVTGGGRTDSGVHARGQVANFYTTGQMVLQGIQRGLNALLPEDVKVRGIDEVSPDFHARYSATQRQYSYTIMRAPHPLARQFAWLVMYGMQIESLQACTKQIIGEHDFQSFCKSEADVAHYRCIVSKAEWAFDGDFMRFHIHANRFLHGMVRALVGTMIDVGRGYRSMDSFKEIMETKDRSAAGMAAPPHGLVLESIIY